ncbi:MAG: hypothetical protein ACTSYS_03330 [Promethearchaeota archaeon]
MNSSTIVFIHHASSNDKPMHQEVSRNSNALDGHEIIINRSILFTELKNNIFQEMLVRFE